ARCRRLGRGDARGDGGRGARGAPARRRARLGRAARLGTTLRGHARRPVGRCRAGEARMTTAPRATPSPRGRPWFWLRLALVAFILWWVVESNGRERIAQALLAADPRWVAAAALVFFLSIIAGAWQWHLLLRIQGITFGFRDCFRSYYSGMFLNNFLPGTVGGDALRVWDVHKRQLAAAQSSLGRAAASTLLDRLMGFSALSVFSLIALALEFHRQDLPRGLLLKLLQAVGTVSAAFILLLLLLLSRRFSGALHALIRALGLERLGNVHA